MARGLSAGSIALLAACSPPGLPLSSALTAAPPAPLTCANAEAATQAMDSTRFLELRRSVEDGPLYAMARSASPLAACRVEQNSGVVTLRYDFVDGGRVRATRDPRIEYSEQVARFAAPPAESAINALMRTERAAFGAEGCGIDWSPAKARVAPVEAGATDTVFGGEVCNCQGRIRSDARGRVIELAFKSAC
jgi:hypothetical protein